MNEMYDTANEQPAPSPGGPVPAEPQHKSVGGWLLLLCIILTVFNPLGTIVTLAVGYSESSEYFAQFPGLMAITVIDTLLSLCLVAFSVYAGIGLWTVRAGAVQTAKRYLLCFLGYLAVTSVLPFIAGLPSEANEAMLPEVIKGAFRSLIFFAIWYSYLNKSQRVRDTYEW